MSNKNESYNVEVEETAKAVGEVLTNFKVPFRKSKEEAWVEFVSQLPVHQQVVKAKERSLKLVFYSVAAGVAMLLSIAGWWYLMSDVNVTCAAGQHKVVELPDMSKVEMNAGSMLTYNKWQWRKNRMVKLDGEAFFKVKKGKKFEVKTAVGKVCVLGTSFNVFARNNKLNVFCQTGKVAVVSVDSVLLTPGMKAICAAGKHSQVVKLQTWHDDAWKKGEFWYNDAPVCEVLQEIERQFNVRVDCGKVTNRFYTGYFNTASLKDALNMVLMPLQLKYEMNNNKIEITNSL